MHTGYHPVCNLLTLRIRRRGGATIGHPKHIMASTTSTFINSAAHIRRTSFLTVARILDHMIDNEVITQNDLYMDLREELADIVFDSIRHHQD